jgi:hypothetical protein
MTPEEAIRAIDATIAERAAMTPAERERQLQEATAKLTHLADQRLATLREAHDEGKLVAILAVGPTTPEDVRLLRHCLFCIVAQLEEGGE